MKTRNLLLFVLFLTVYLVLISGISVWYRIWYEDYFSVVSIRTDVFHGLDHAPGFTELILAGFRSPATLLFFLLTAVVYAFLSRGLWAVLLRYYNRFTFLYGALLSAVLLVAVHFLMECLLCLWSHHFFFWDYVSDYFFAPAETVFYFLFAVVYTGLRLRTYRRKTPVSR